MSNRLSVALLIETSNAYARGLVDGIVAYQREHDLWSIYLGEHEREAKPPQWLKNWRGDGIVARIETDAMAKAVSRSGIPVVDVSAARLVPNIPWVETDDREIARLAVRHLADRGFQNLAYCGEPHFNWSVWRQESFLAFAKDAGCETYFYEGKSRHDKRYSWSQERDRMTAWIDSLPKPVGMMACYDFKGQQVLDICRELNLAAPEQVAVIGVDNDVGLCRLCAPPLSSVIPNTQRTGYEAALLLDRMMRGEEVEAEALLIPPVGIAERQSTDMFAIDDPDIVAALRYIRENACDGISVADVLRVTSLSRRMLEQRFLKLVRRTPHAEITRIRMERAGRLLRETSLPLKTIAERVGFNDALYLSRAFKKYTGASPRAYRKGLSNAEI